MDLISDLFTHLETKKDVLKFQNKLIIIEMVVIESFHLLQSRKLETLIEIVMLHLGKNVLRETGERRVLKLPFPVAVPLNLCRVF